MADLTSDLAYYASQSAFSDPGMLTGMLDSVPRDVAAMKDAVTPLVFHYMGDGDWAENGISPDRRPEIDLRYADRMLGRLRELSDKPLGEMRAPHERMVGCCRDFTLLFVSLLRHQGIPARSRVGFAAYFFAGWNVDHVVAEVWDAAESRWRLIDPELRAGHVDPTDGVTIDPLDLPRDRFLVGADAWLRCREGGEDPERYLVSPFLDIPQTRGFPYLLHNLVHELAALNKREMILWDDWGISEAWDSLADDQLSLLDQTAQTMLASEVTVSDLQRLYDRDEFRVPGVVTSYTSAVENPPIQVWLRGNAVPSS
ncbi:MAG TPA: transglutaminase-like domain-containing protein [Thermomicrobiales bacterium]|nr:transglutaminase-like domain-containing protein [Thermomicrobiales bacterium]